MFRILNLNTANKPLFTSSLSCESSIIVYQIQYLSFPKGDIWCTTTPQEPEWQVTVLSTTMNNLKNLWLSMLLNINKILITIHHAILPWLVNINWGEKKNRSFGWYKRGKDFIINCYIYTQLSQFNFSKIPALN